MDFANGFPKWAFPHRGLVNIENAHHVIFIVTVDDDFLPDDARSVPDRFGNAKLCSRCTSLSEAVNLMESINQDLLDDRLSERLWAILAVGAGSLKDAGAEKQPPR